MNHDSTKYADWEAEVADLLAEIARLENAIIRWGGAIVEKRALMKIREENFIARERASCMGEPRGDWRIAEREHDAVVCAAARQGAATKALMKIARKLAAEKRNGEAQP